MSGLNPSILLVANFLAAGLFAAIYHQASRRCDKGLFLAVVGLVTLIITILLFWWQASRDPAMLDFLSHSLIGYWILLVVPLLGALYAMQSYSQLRVSEVLPTYVHLPLRRVQLLLVLFGAFFLLPEPERLPLLKMLGIGAAFVPIILSLVRKRAAAPQRGNVSALPIFWLVAVVVLGALLQLSTKLALDEKYSIAVPALCFVILSNLGSALVAIGANLFSSVKVKEASMTIALGFIGGILNVATFVTLTEYLVSGDASIVYTTSAVAFLIPTALYQGFGTESSPSSLDWVAYVCAVLAVVALVSLS